MKITKNELRQLVQEAVKEKMKLQEGSDFMARRDIEHSARALARQFEEEIIKQLNLKDPNLLHDAVQEEYYKVTEIMREKVIKVIEETVQMLSGFPRNEGGKNHE